MVGHSSWSETLQTHDRDSVWKLSPSDPLQVKCMLWDYVLPTCGMNACACLEFVYFSSVSLQLYSMGHI